jgi:hypothetical protein
MSTTIDEPQAYYQAGIGVLAVELDVGLRRLSVGYRHHETAEPTLEPLDVQSVRKGQLGSLEREQIEDYLTTCLAGSAAQFLYSLNRRCQLKQSFGAAGLEMKYLRRMWDCVEPETDRAFAIAFGLLGHVDDGDAEGTMLRLWQRAVTLLRQPPQREQLTRLAQHLRKVERMSGGEVHRFLHV